jgi:hypothetical protein
MDLLLTHSQIAEHLCKRYMTITATITEVIEETVYQGTVYEYRVVVEYNGMQFGVFDYNKHASPDHIGKEVELEIVPFIITSAEIVDEKEGRVEPNEENPRDWKLHSYVGEISSTSVNETITVSLALNGDTVSIESNGDNEYGRLIQSCEVGDTVRITTARTDLHGVTRINRPD